MKTKSTATKKMDLNHHQNTPPQTRIAITSSINNQRSKSQHQDNRKSSIEKY